MIVLLHDAEIFVTILPNYFSMIDLFSPSVIPNKHYSLFFVQILGRTKRRLLTLHREAKDTKQTEMNKNH